MNDSVPSTKSKITGLKVFLWFFIGIGFVAISVGANLAFQSFRCKSWPTSQGIIRSAKMGRHRSNKGGTTYSADVSYDYSVGGSRYTGTKVAFGTMSASASYAQNILNHYPVGGKVPVYYSPGDPQTAVLERGIHGGTWVCFGVGSAFALFGIAFLQFLKRVPAADQPAPRPVDDGKRIHTPQILAGAIVILFGISPMLIARTSASGPIILYVVGAIFCLAGLHIMTYRPGDNSLARFFSIAISLLMMGVFHWLTFGGMGEVDTFFAIILGVVDVIILAVAIGWLFKRMKVKARGL